MHRARRGCVWGLRILVHVRSRLPSIFQIRFSLAYGLLLRKRQDNRPRSGDAMEPIKVAAHFAAFACYLNREKGKSLSPTQAGRYARANWKRFIPYVDEN